MSKDKVTRIEITKQTTVNRKPARIGDVIDTGDADARYLIGTKRAIATDKNLHYSGSPNAKKGKETGKPGGKD